MGLVRELEAKKTAARWKLLEKARDYLSGSGIKAVLADEPTTDIIGRPTTEPVLRLSRGNIDNIQLLSTDYLSCGMAGGVSRFQYEVRADKELGHELEKKLKAKIKLVKENKTLGLLGGKVTGVTWTGGELADLLNSDSEIAGKILDCVESRGNPDFKILATGPSSVSILGPSFYDAEKIDPVFESGGSEKLGDCVFGFKICDRIAGYIRELIGKR